MTKPSKGAAAFLAFFGLMFLVPGLLSLVTFLVSGRNGSARATLSAAAIALFISSIGAGFLLAALVGFRRLKEQAGVEEANPSSPWLWRSDWANRRAESLRKNSERTAWIVCLLGNLVIVPLTVAMVSELTPQKDPYAYLAIGFLLIGAILFANALRETLRRRSFGDTYFELYSLPFYPGGRLAGRIHLKLDVEAQHGIDLRLSCVRKTIRGTGDSRSVVKTVLWQTEQNVPFGGLGLEPLGKMIPVDFAIPSDAYVTDHDNFSDQVLWLLHAQADVPGIDYSDDFELPVFKTFASMEQAPANNAPDTFGFTTGTFSQGDPSPVSAPEHAKVVVTSDSGVTEFYFPAFRTPSRSLFLIFFSALWTGVVFFLFHSNAPLFFSGIFGLTDLLMILALLHITLGTTRIRASNGEVTSTKRILGIGSTNRFAVSEIDSIMTVTSGQQGGSEGNAMYAIRLRAKNGRRFTLADEIGSRQEARWIVAQIETLTGMKIDTRVESDLRFGPPPRPGQTLFGSPQPTSARPALQQSRPQSIASTVFGFIVFAAFVIGMFAWQGWRFSGLKAAASAAHTNGSRTNGSTADGPRVSGAVNGVPVRRFASAAMTNADAERVLAMPAQDQAEELLERAIEHDPRALDLFEQQVESWVGHIQLTDRMKQLERRSEYSSDLRVRYANADINLTLDGWQKNEQAAGMLIERARTDLKYRAAAVYFLGMLAGRGVAYDKIHPVLLNYAKHDPDAYVRQWAVEGMRYLGKDEALDELFESFTQDPSSNVRDRAGCNISDCGNFTRAQRVRMVPKFLELVSDASTSAQMRAWSFLALHEITDENIPADAQAWRTWYAQHGAGKLAAFERLDWWQVRGDE
ncbi:MAG: HEAT repeat domain-containing protein [Candidatus Acidiferrum sp.]